MTKPNPVRKDRNGVPIDPKDWTVQDWRDLYRSMKRLRAKVSKNHKPITEE